MKYVPFSAGPGQPFDVVYQIGDDPQRRMGFIYSQGPQMVRVSDFAPAVRIGGDPAFQEGVYNPIVISSLHMGSDRARLKAGDEGRYRDSDGNIAAQYEGRITLASAWKLTDTSLSSVTAWPIVEFRSPNGTTICIGGKSGGNRVVLTWDSVSQSWVARYPSAGFSKDIKHLFATDKYLFVALGSASNAWRWDGSSGDGGWTQLGSAADLYGFHKNRLFRALGNTLYKADTNNNGDSWKATTYEVGLDTTPITDLVTSNGLLLICKPEGLYVFDDDAGKVYQLIDLTHAYNDNNLRGMTESGGSLFFRIGNKVKTGQLASINSISYSDITPQIEETTNEDEMRWGHGEPVRFIDTPAGMYCAFSAPLGTTMRSQVLYFNGVGWHKVYQSGAGKQIQAFGYSPYYGKLVVARDGEVEMKSISSSAMTEYPDYASSGSIVLPRIDAGYPDMMKLFGELVLTVDNASSTETVEVYTSADGGNTYELAATISSSGENRIALGTLGKPLAAKDLTIKLLLKRGSDVTKTPVIRMPIVLRVMTAPKATYAIVDALVVDKDQPLRNGWGAQYGDATTPQDALSFLLDMGRTREIIRRFGHDGSARLVRCSDTRIDYTGFGDRVEPMSSAAAITLVDAFPGSMISISSALRVLGAGESVVVATAQYADYSGTKTWTYLLYP